MPDRSLLFVASNGGCTRVHKQAACLAARGWTIDLLSDNHSEDWRCYGDIYRDRVVSGQETWGQAVAGHDADLIHYHNEPDAPFELVHRAAGGRPVVYDVHDMSLFKRGLTLASEYAFANAAAIVHVTPEVRDAAAAIFPHRAPTIVLENWPVKRIVERYARPTGDGSVVYVGGMVPIRSDGYWRHRYWRGVDDTFAANGIDVHWMARNSHECHVRYPLPWHPYAAMLAELVRHSWGLVGSEVKRIMQGLASPNKAWEYLALGLPLLVLNHDRLKRELKGAAGIYASSVDGLVAGMRKADWPHLHRQAMRRRRFMEQQIGELEAVYEELL